MAELSEQMNVKYKILVDPLQNGNVGVYFVPSEGMIDDTPKKS